MEIQNLSISRFQVWLVVVGCGWSDGIFVGFFIFWSARVDTKKPWYFYHGPHCYQLPSSGAS